MFKIRIYIIFLILCACKGENQTSKKQIQDQKNVEIQIHKTIETFMILRSIADKDLLFQYRDSTYKGKPIMYNARKAFAEYKNHPAVAETQKLLDKTSSTGDLILQGLLYFEELPAKSQKYEITSDVWKDKKETLTSYVNTIHQFYHDANVEAFLTKQTDFYKGAITEAKSYMAADLIFNLEGYFGIKNHAYKMILIPNSPFGMGFGAKVTSIEGDIFYQIISPSNEISWNKNANYTTYGYAGEGAKEYYRDLVIHEFCHPFITPFLESSKMKHKIAQSASLYTLKLDSVMTKQGYGTWWGYVNEHLVRLAEIRIAKQMNEQSTDQMRNNNIKKNGFVLLPEAENLIEEYENNRNTYPNIRLFLPKLIAQFDAVSKEEIDKKLQEVVLD